MKTSVEMQKELKKVRNDKGFNAKEWVDKTVRRLNHLVNNTPLTRVDSVVIPISGGVDSAVVYKLFKLSELKVYPIFIYTAGSKINSIEQQHFALKHAKLLVSVPELVIINNARHIDNYLQYKVGHLTSWGMGQVEPLVRTLMAHTYKVSLEEKGKKVLVAGTINKSEAYLGFFGKSSDNVVDIQPIWDLWKSEVYEVAKYLKVPKDIIEREPTGDVYNGNTDEETFGFPYDFLEIKHKFIGHPWSELVVSRRLHNQHKFNAYGEPITTAITFD